MTEFTASMPLEGPGDGLHMNVIEELNRALRDRGATGMVQISIGIDEDGNLHALAKGYRDD